MVAASRPTAALPHLVILLGLTALPTAVPTNFGAGGVTVLYAEVVLAGAVAWAVTTLPSNRCANRRTAALVAFLGLGVLVGLQTGNPTKMIVSDSRGIIITILACALGARLAGTEHVPKLLRTIRWSLWISAAVIALALATGITIGGNSEAATLYTSGAAESIDGPTRYLTSATPLALATICVTIALMMSDRLDLKAAIPYLAPALFITLTAFSRNSILAVAAAALFAIFAAATIRGAFSTLARVIVVGLALWLLAYLAPWAPGVDVVGEQVQAFSTRVLAGLNPDTIATDASSQYRLVETTALLQQIDTSPVIGHGIGLQYKPPSGTAGSFTATSGTYYAHNFYLWALAKTGIVGLLIFLFACASPLVIRQRPASTLWVGAASALAGFLVASVVAPMPLGAIGGSALVFGILVGVTARSKDLPEKLAERTRGNLRRYERQQS
jgi:O-antigen ligase